MAKKEAEDSQALGVLVADEGLVEAGLREVRLLPHHAGDDGVVELGTLHVGLGEVHAVHHGVRQVSSCSITMLRKKYKGDLTISCQSGSVPGRRFSRVII